MFGLLFLCMLQCVLHTANSQFPPHIYMGSTDVLTHTYNCTISVLVDTASAPRTPWSHYFVPMDDLLNSLNQSYDVVSNLLSINNGVCQAHYSSDLSEFLPKRLLREQTNVTECEGGLPDSIIPAQSIESPYTVTYICLNGASPSCLQNCGEISKDFVLKANDEGEAYDIGRYDMYILALQSTRHSTSHQYKATVTFTRFDLDPLPSNYTDCGYNGDYLEIFDLVTLEYTTLCTQDGQGLEINTTHTLYVTFHTDLVVNQSAGWQMNISLLPFSVLTPGFRSLELSNYVSTEPCNETIMQGVFKSHTYLTASLEPEQVISSNSVLSAFTYSFLSNMAGDIIDVGEADECEASYGGVLQRIMAKEDEQLFTRYALGVSAHPHFSRHEMETLLAALNIPASVPVNATGLSVIGSYKTGDYSLDFCSSSNTPLRTSSLVRSNDNDCPAGWSYFSHKCYLLVRESLNFIGAKENCESIHSSLVTWDHLAYSRLFSYWEYQNCTERFWLGTHKNISTGEWVNSKDGSEIKFPPPLADAFDDDEPERDCIVADFYEGDMEFYWLNEDCGSSYQFVCVRDALAGHHLGTTSKDEASTSPTEDIYEIVLAQQYVARIEFIHLNSSVSLCSPPLLCPCDAYVEISDTLTGHAQKLCPSDVPKVMYTTSANTRVYKSAPTVLFSAFVQPIYSRCGGTLHTAYQGYISSPGYPSNSHGRDISCLYLIGYSQRPDPNDINSFARGVQVTVEFESLTAADNCSSSVTVFDGLDTSAPIVFSGCRFDSRTIISSSPVVLLSFYSFAGSDGASFLLKYTIGCDSIRPHSLAEEFTVPGILPTWSAPNLMCTVNLLLPRRPYVSFGASCRMAAPSPSASIIDSFTCYGTNTDLSTHIPRLFAQSDEYLYNADSKLVHSIWYFHMGATAHRELGRGYPLSIVVRPKGETNLLLYMPLDGTFNDLSQFAHSTHYNKSVDLEDIFQLLGPWQMDGRFSMAASENLNLVVELPSASPIRALQGFSFVFWINTPDCRGLPRLILEFRSVLDASNPEGLQAHLTNCHLVLHYNSDWLVTLPFAKPHWSSLLTGWKRVAFGWNEFNREIWTYIDGQFRYNKNYNGGHMSGLLADFPLLVIGGNSHTNTSHLKDIVSCLQLYNHSLSVYEIEDAHFLCAPEMSANIYIPLDQDLSELHRGQQLTVHVTPPTPTSTSVLHSFDFLPYHGMLFTNQSAVRYPDIVHNADIYSWTVMFWLNIQDPTNQTILTLSVNNSQHLSVTSQQGYIAIDGHIIAVSRLVALVPYNWSQIALVVDMSSRSVEVWVDEYRSTVLSTAYNSVPLSHRPFDIEFGPASGFSLSCFQMFFWRLYQRDLVEAQKQCQRAPSLKKLDCDPGWTLIYRNTSKESYCVRHMGEVSSESEAMETCAAVDSTPLLYGDMETVYSSSYTSPLAATGILSGIYYSRDAQFLSLYPEQRGVTWSWTEGLLLDPENEVRDGANLTGSTCELLTNDIDIDIPCRTSMSRANLPAGSVLLTRNTPAYKNSKVPHLLYPLDLVQNLHVICARQDEAGIQVPLGVCHSFTDTASSAGLYYTTGLYVPWFHTLRVSLREGGYITCPRQSSLMSSTIDFCGRLRADKELFLDIKKADLIRQPKPIANSNRFQISYYKDSSQPQFKISLQAYYLGLGADNSHIDTNMALRVVEDPIEAIPRPTFKHGYFQLRVAGIWRNYCDDDVIAIRSRCRERADSDCKLVEYGYIDTGMTTDPVNSTGHPSSVCSNVQAMWVKCLRCYLVAGYTKYGPPTRWIASPGYGHKSYTPGVFREYTTAYQLTNDMTDAKMRVRFDGAPDIDCSNGDELYAVNIPYQSSLSMVRWSYCSNETNHTDIQIPANSLLMFRSTSNSTGGIGFAASLAPVCGDDMKVQPLSQTTPTDVVFNVAQVASFECTRIYTVDDRQLYVIVKSGQQMSSLNESYHTLRVGYGEISDDHILFEAKDDFQKIDAVFSSHTTYWISYNYSIQLLCDQQDLAKPVGDVVALELQALRYYHINQPAGEVNPPNSMYNSDGLVYSDQIVVWLIEKVDIDYMHRLDFERKKFGVPCGDVPSTRSWLRLRCTNATSLKDIYSSDSLHNHNYRDSYVCDKDIDTRATLSDVVHWYSDEEPISCSCNLLVMLVVEQQAAPIIGVTFLFRQMDISESTTCGNTTTAYRESSTFHGRVLHSPFHPQEMPRNLRYNYTFHSVNSHQYKLKQMQVSPCLYLEMTARQPSSDVVDNLCISSVDQYMYGGGAPLILQMNSYNNSRPSAKLLRNALSGGSSFLLSFHQVLDVDAGCYSSDTYGYPTTFERRVDEQYMQKITFNNINISMPSCDKPCCHSFEYGSGDIVGQHSQEVVCVTPDDPAAFYTAHNKYWARIYVDSTLPPGERPVVAACFEQIDFVIHRTLTDTLTLNNAKPTERHQTVYYISVLAGVGIRLLFTDLPPVCESSCCHIVVVGEGHPTSYLNGPLMNSSQCLSQLAGVTVWSANELWIVVYSMPQQQPLFDLPFAAYTTFVECTSILLDGTDTQQVYWDSSIGDCVLNVSTANAAAIQLQLVVDLSNILGSGGVIASVEVRALPSGDVLLNHKLDGSPIALVLNTSHAQVSISLPDETVRRRRHVTSSAHNHRLLLQFTAASKVCHLDRNSSITQISSSGYTTGWSYRPNTMCTWSLPQPAISNLAYLIEFDSRFAVSRHPRGYCLDFILIINGDGSVAAGPLCGLTTPSPLYTKPGEAVTFVFYTDDSIELAGWQLQHSFVLGDIVDGLEGAITSPQYPVDYPPDTHMQYYITVPQGYRIHLYIIDMDIQTCINCLSCDYIQYGTQVLCGEKPSEAPQIWSQGNTMSLLFVSDSRLSGRGFKAVYQAFKDCDALFTKDYGSFTSPGFSHEGMEAGTECFYTIVAEDNHSIVLSYTAKLDYNVHTDECYSYILVRDGAYKLSPSTHGRQCGTVSRQNLLSHGTDMHVQLSVGEGKEPADDHGFAAMYFTYKSYYTEDSEGISLPLSLHTNTDLYLPNLRLIWTIEVSDLYCLKLTPSHVIDLQSVAGHCLDKLDIYHKAYGESVLSLLHNSSYFCSNQPSLISMFTPNNILKIVFSSNAWNEATGFGTLTYTALPKVYSLNPGVISPFDLGLYLADDMHQDYFISLPAEYYIDMEFTEWIGINCISASMSMGEGTQVGTFTYHQMQGYCSVIPSPVYSITNNIWVSYIQKAYTNSSDWSLASFKLSYVGELRVRTSPGTITSPGYPHNYPQHLARSWILVAPAGHVIRVEISDLDMPAPDYLLMGDGIHTHENILRKYNSMPYNPTYSTANEMWLFFYSHEDNETAKGFSLTFAFEQRSFTYPAATFISPVDSTGYYVLDFTSTWTVTVRDGRRIQINISLDLPPAVSCLPAAISAAGLNQPLADHCGVISETSLFSTGNTFSISLRTDLDVLSRSTHTGVTLSYSYVPLPADCHFEGVMCGYTNIEVLKWVIGEGVSATAGTGQQHDSRFAHIDSVHIGDKYLMVKATGHYYGQTAAVVSPVLSKGSRRLSFAYLMRGSEVGTLRVLQMPTTADGAAIAGFNVIWSRTGHQAADWLYAVDIPASGNTSNYVIIIEAILGSGRIQLDQPITEGDILIDDIYMDALQFETCRGDSSMFYCYNGGLCIDLSQSYDKRGHGCLCPEGYYGAYCELEIIDCTPDMCSMHGTCYEAATYEWTYWCSCHKGYIGLHCQHDTDECTDSSNDLLTLCSSNGMCVDGIGTFSCSCECDYYGVHCQHQYLPCETRENPCGQVEGRGHCIDMEGADKYRCVCDYKYTGEHCEVLHYDFCAANPCNKTDSAASCVSAASSYYCLCSDGFYGYECLNKLNYCQGVTCHSGGTCIDGRYNFTCACTHGYTGLLCESRIDSCVSNTCSHTGSRWCVSSSVSYRCECREGYEGRYCEVATDFCQTTPCTNGGTCESLITGFRCICPSGYGGHLCEVGYNACVSNPCMHGGACEQTSVGYQCRCLPQLDGPRCEHLVRRCSAGYCQHRGTCYDTFNGAVCNCEHDYTGERCQSKIDDCMNHRCAAGATCIDSIISYVCKCPSGSYGQLCEERIDPCSTNRCVHGECDSLSNQPDGSGEKYACNCFSGFTGLHCTEQINECQSNPCQHNSRCIDTVDKFICVCSPGYYGERCVQQVDYCTDSNCSANSACLSTHLGFVCHCDVGYTGRYCDENMNDCIASACHNGNCTDGDNSYSCACNAPWTGLRCTTRLSHCHKYACGLYSGYLECLETPDGYICRCPVGYYGDRCELKAVFCDIDRCTQTSDCVELSPGYFCVCQHNWGGTDCSTSLVCLDLECSTRGQCLEILGVTAHCTCNDYWEGRACRAPVDSCQSSPCGVYGTCYNLLDDEYRCHCSLGTRGTDCIDDIDNCIGVRCEHGGTCQDRRNDFKCECISLQYAGRFCEIDLQALMANNSVEFSSMIDASAELSPRRILLDLWNDSVTDSCHFGTSSKSIVFIVSNLIALFLLAVVCAFLSRAYLSKQRGVSSDSVTHQRQGR